MRHLRAALALSALLIAPSADAQPYVLASPVEHLATIFTDLYGPSGLIVDSQATLPGEQPHSAHFNSDFQSDFSQFSTALVSQFVSRAAAVARRRLHLRVRSEPRRLSAHDTELRPDSRRPRRDTLGARRVSVGFAYQRFTSTRIEGLDLHTGAGCFHARQRRSCSAAGGRGHDLQCDRRATSTRPRPYLTLGVTERFDLSVAVPFISDYVKVVSDAHHPAPRHDQSADALLPPGGRRGRRRAGCSPPWVGDRASAT